MSASTGGRRPASGVTRPLGFVASGVSCGIRRKAGAPDLALVVSDRDASAACLFTTNRVKAAPVLVSREALETSRGVARAVVLNAGNANACTGEAGLLAARRTARETAALLGTDPSRVLVASTGVIGQQLPIDRLVAALPEAVRSLDVAGHDAAARAIMTTDLMMKESGAEAATSDGLVQVGGMAKGSGMIHPDMATTLAVVTTDAACEPGLLREMLKGAADRTFHRITVDGDTSTNDVIALLANGASGVRVGERDAAPFAEALETVLRDLAVMIARDGEGAKKLIAVTVTGARTESEAARVAMTIAGSPLVKTAVAGEDANWGRIVAAAGRAGVDLVPEKLTVKLGHVTVLEPGYVSRHSEDDATAALKGDAVDITVDLALGSARATAWTCDLTHGYIDINASYRS